MLQMEQSFFLVITHHQPLITMELLECMIMDGVIYVMTTILTQLKLMSFVISWDTLELQATLEL
uniref:Uncharacterized protein n=1 Tax=Amphimedon queenslandica TaxID=400682 RepID=A0A1X7T117_AMPQE